MKKQLGKIESVKFGIGGYQDAMIGIHFSFSGKGFGVCDSKCCWSPSIITPDKHSKWTEEDRTKQIDEIVRYIDKLLNQAKVQDINKLKGIPVEMEFENSSLKSWRILEEVL